MNSMSGDEDTHECVLACPSGDGKGDDEADPESLVVEQKQKQLKTTQHLVTVTADPSGRESSKSAGDEPLVSSVVEVDDDAGQKNSSVIQPTHPNSGEGGHDNPTNAPSHHHLCGGSFFF